MPLIPQEIGGRTKVIYWPALLLALISFFSISFITNIFGPIFPSLIVDFNINLTLAGFFPFAFFTAYFVMSIPAGLLIERWGDKPILLLAYTLSALGALCFANSPGLISALLSLFLIGAAMALLQVVINPLLRSSGGVSNFAFFAVLAQLLFGTAAAISPWVYRYFSFGIAANNPDDDALIALMQILVDTDMPWLSMYWLFALLSLVMLLVVSAIKLPRSLPLAPSGQLRHIQWQLLHSKTVLFYFVGIVAYVAAEQGVANAISVFLLRYHDFDPDMTGARAVSLFWLLMTLGCLFGLALLKLFDSRRILMVVTVLAALTLTLALLGSAKLSLYAFPMVGFFLSVMWPLIFSLALNSIDKHHSVFAGILCTGIVGGALASPVIGLISDSFNDLRLGMLFVYICLAYVFILGYFAAPLVSNQKIEFVPE